MEKVKLDFGNIQEEAVEVTGKNGDKVMVRKRIPYVEKEAQAYELAAGSFVIDAEGGVCYTSFKKNLLDKYLIAKYYTNIDVSDIEDDDGYMKLFDYLYYNELYDKIGQVIAADYFGCVSDMAWHLSGAAEQVYEKKNSLAYKLDQTFGFLFTGEDLTDQIAAAEGVNEKMVDMFKALQERDEKNALLKNSKAKVSSGGAVLNMAKK